MDTIINPLSKFGFDKVGLKPGTILTPGNIYIPILALENMKTTIIDNNTIGDYWNDEEGAFVIMESGLVYIKDIHRQYILVCPPDGEVLILATENENYLYAPTIGLYDQMLSTNGFTYVFGGFPYNSIAGVNLIDYDYFIEEVDPALVESDVCVVGVFEKPLLLGGGDLN